jgi:hypothetical protein
MLGFANIGRQIFAPAQVLSQAPAAGVLYFCGFRES